MAPKNVNTAKIARSKLLEHYRYNPSTGKLRRSNNIVIIQPNKPAIVTRTPIDRDIDLSCLYIAFEMSEVRSVSSAFKRHRLLRYKKFHKLRVLSTQRERYVYIAQYGEQIDPEFQSSYAQLCELGCNVYKDPCFYSTGRDNDNAIYAYLTIAMYLKHHPKLHDHYESFAKHLRNGQYNQSELTNIIKRTRLNDTFHHLNTISHKLDFEAINRNTIVPVADDIIQLKTR